MVRQWKLGLISALLLLSACYAAQEGPLETDKTSPKVVNASVPFYPELARQTHIQGVVTLRVFTNGKQVSAVNAENGQRLLLDAARENVKTWEFQPHTPTNFEVIFLYKLLPVTCDSQCKCDSAENESVLLQLPNRVEISAKQSMLCDPAVEIRPKKSGAPD